MIAEAQDSASANPAKEVADTSPKMKGSSPPNNVPIGYVTAEGLVIVPEALRKAGGRLRGVLTASPSVKRIRSPGPLPSWYDTLV